MIPTKQTVYLPLNNDWDINITDYTLMDVDGEYLKNITEKHGYFFTPEQLNEYTANVIKQALETATEKANVKVIGANYVGSVVKESITNTFEQTFEKFKV